MKLFDWWEKAADLFWWIFNIINAFESEVDKASNYGQLLMEIIKPWFSFQIAIKSLRTLVEGLKIFNLARLGLVELNIRLFKGSLDILGTKL